MCTESPMWVLCFVWLFLWWRKVCGQGHQCGCFDTMKECENTGRRLQYLYRVIILV
jgi:hypothetical protein